MPKLRLLTLVLTLAGCSSSTSAFVRHMCDEAVVVSVWEVRNNDELTVTTVAPDADTEVWSYCCDPGHEPELEISAGGWSTQVDFDDLSDGGAPVVQFLPAEACAF